MKVTNIVVFCAGPHARVILDIIKDLPNFNVVGVIDSLLEIGSNYYGYNVIGRQNDLNGLCETYNFDAGIVALGDNYWREKLVDEIIEQQQYFQFINVISTFSFVSETVQMGYGNVIMPGVVINSEAIIGDHCIINSNSVLEHDCKMNNFSSLSPGVTTGGYVSIGKYSAIALGAIIRDRVTVGENVVVGSGSVVTKDLDENGLYFGVPAKRIRDRKPFEKFLK